MAKEKVLSLTDPTKLSVSYLREMRVRGQALYMIVLLMIACGVSSLPFIYIDVSASGEGFLQVPLERNQLVLPVSGKVSLLHIQENGYVHTGDTLVEIDASGGQQHDRLLALRIRELEQLITDAQNMANAIASHKKPTVHTQRYISAWEQYKQQLENAQVQLDLAHREHERFRILFEKRVVSVAEYERYQNTWKQATLACEGVNNHFRSQWSAEATTYRSELHDLSRQRAEWKSQESYYTLTAPLSGTIQNLAGIQSGTSVFANQKIAEISPDSTLVAMVYVSPKEVGLIRQGQEVRIQVDAFNYNQWGMMMAVVEDIADDMVLDAHNQPVFKVKCILADTKLVLPNGYEGQLRKGMTFRARFLVARRTLYQLLYDKVDDWLNPNIA